MMRIAVAGFVHETNTFAPFPTQLADFSGFDGLGLARGNDVFTKTPHKVSLHGFADAARAAGHLLVPLIHAHAQPAAQVSREAFESICRELLEGLQGAGSLDAVFLELHGAMVAEHIHDADAEVLRRVRDLVGPAVPVVVTLDSHGNVGADLVKLADAVVAYRTYPHVDMRETGERAFALLAPMMETPQRLHSSWRAIPYLMPINLQTTMAQPCARLYERLAVLEREAGAGTCLSMMTGFPLADVPQCHPCVFGYGPDRVALESAVQALYDAVCGHEASFVTTLPDAATAVSLAMQEPQGSCTVLADVQDNAGGGATSDTAWIVEALIDAHAPDAVVGLMYDPEAARAAHDAGVGATLDLRLGAKLMPGHSTRKLGWVVEALHLGDFLLKGPMLGGGRMDLGPMVQLRHAGVRVVVTSRRTWYVERECFSVCGVAPHEHRIVVVKSTNHYRADFTSMATRIIEFAAPAAVAMDPATLPYSHLMPGMRLHGHGPSFQPEDPENELRAARPVMWLHPQRAAPLAAEQATQPGKADVEAAADRFRRFAPLLARVFPELAASRGLIDSPLQVAAAMQAALEVPKSFGRLLVKADHLLPVAGSIKARGGVHEVLEFAEQVAREHGLLDADGSHEGLASARAREVFSRYLVAVGSTGNLGLSIGVTAAALGFRTAVHMSSEAKAWKKKRLRDLGVTVIEHKGDYQAAVAAGRAHAQSDPLTHFVDDERSLSLLLGYASAVPHLLVQFAALGVRIDAGHPLFVYLPCGVGGAPGGIALGLSLLAGANVHCFFGEPVQSPCFALKALRPDLNRTVYDAGLTNITEADGLAVPQASDLAARVVAPFLAGGFTVDDDTLLRHLSMAHAAEGMRLEPSAATGFSGPAMLLRTDWGRRYLAKTGLTSQMQQATHIAWTTGGGFVPQPQFDDFLARGAALA